MPDIYDPDRGLIISLTDDDYEDYQDGKLSEDFYARRTDGSIANRVDISRLDDDSDDDGEPSDGIDVGSAAIGALIVAAVGGAVYGIKSSGTGERKKRLEKRQRKHNTIRKRVHKSVLQLRRLLRVFKKNEPLIKAVNRG